MSGLTIQKLERSVRKKGGCNLELEMDAQEAVKARTNGRSYGAETSGFSGRVLFTWSYVEEALFVHTHSS
jgi:hypothetical protein